MDKDRETLYRQTQANLATGERAVGAFPFATVPKRPKGPEGKITEGIRQTTKRYRPLVCTNRRVLIYNTGRTFAARGLLASYLLSEVSVVDVLPGRWGGKVLVLDLGDEGPIPFELGTKDLLDLDTVLATIGEAG